MAETAERIVLASRPVGEPTLDNFRFEEFPIPQPGPSQMLLRTLWLSLDPYMRGQMTDAPSYAKPVGIGGVMEGGAVSEVVASNVPRFAKGDIVVGRTGWQTHALSDGSSLQKVDPTRAPIQTALGVLGMPGMTAYMGLLEIGKPAAGETVVVAAASGAVGSVVGQIARIKGGRAVGIAGGSDKCRYVTEELGFDASIDHRAPDLAARLATACPKGIDVYFENVGGAVFEAVFPLLNPFARIPVCGLISMYNATSLSPGPILVPHLMRAILTKRLSSNNTRTPNWDVASTCTIEGKAGILLIEAKAHDQELIKEETGRKNIGAPVSGSARRNLLRIDWAIRDASAALAENTGLTWALSRDWNYQMSNRFAWAWKLTDLGVPVVLIYLGFLGASEMRDKGNPLVDAAAWDTVMKRHS